VEWKGNKINLIDTPGYFDYEGEVLQGLKAADAAAIVVSAKNNLHVGTEKAYKYCQKKNMPNIFVVTKIDEENGDFMKVYTALRQQFGMRVCALTYPVIGNGKVMDNVDCGGMAARIDLESGKLLTVGADKAGNTFTKHPITGTDIIGFTIPYWEEAKAMCMEAARKVPQMRFIAWDVAITENGPTFIEGNSFPSHAVPQFAAHYPDGIGILPEFRKFIDC
jgi:translation elongation factor EF-G